MSEQNSITINIAKDFSKNPGGRFINQGNNSGEEFRIKYLEPYFDNLKDESNLIIVLDGTNGYATSFLDGAFGELARKYGSDRCMKRISFESEEDDLLIKEIQGYIQGAKKKP
ncbi:MAG: STAS-like domain-containing protein [Leptospiraceae bacterium]|nr:STAS-like domain-containing protein [Leptospiraceae bacterium]